MEVTSQYFRAFPMGVLNGVRQGVVCYSDTTDCLLGNRKSK